MNNAENFMGIIKALMPVRLLLELSILKCKIVMFWRYTHNPEDKEG